MILQILHAAQGLDAALGRKLGPAYNAVLGIGLVIEIARRLLEFGDLPGIGAEAARPVLAVALFGFLLLHQLGELAEHIDQRRKQRGLTDGADR